MATPEAHAAKEADLDSSSRPSPTDSTVEQKELQSNDPLPHSDHENENQTPDKNKASPGDANGADLAPAKTTDSERRRRTPLDQQATPKKVVIMFALCMAVFLAALDSTIIGTALPSIADAFNVSASQYAWIGSAYLLAAAAATPTWGKVSDIFGRKPIILIANVVFFIGSALCGAATNIHMLLAGRVIQGIGCGGLLVLVNIAIGDLVSLSSRSAYYGFVGATWAIAGALGPIVGGALSSKVTWRWCFYINLPCDGIAFFVLMLFLDIETPKTPLLDGLKAIDWLGTLACVGAVVMFLFGLESGGVTHPWSSAYVLCLIIFGIVTFAIFVLLQWKVSKYPMMPLRLFTSRSRVACFFSCFSHGTVFIAGSFYLPLYFQSVLGQSPLMSGVYLLPFIMSMTLASGSTGVLIKKTGKLQEAIWAGFVLMALGFGLFIDLPAEINWVKLFFYQFIAGLGIGPNFQAPLLALQSHLKPKDVGTGTATFAFTRQLSSGISIVVGGVIFQNRMKAHAEAIRAALAAQPNLQVPPNVAAQLGFTGGQPPHNTLVSALTGYLTGGSAEASALIVKDLPEPARSVIRQAYTTSLSNMWIYYTVIAIAGLAASLLIGKKQLTKEHEVRRTGLDVQEKERQEKLEKDRRKREKKAASKDGKHHDPEKALEGSAETEAKAEGTA